MRKEKKLSDEHLERVKKDLLDLCNCKEETIWIDGHFAQHSGECQTNGLDYISNFKEKEDK